MAYRRPTFADTAREMAHALQRGGDPFLAARDLVDAYRRAPRSERSVLLAEPPPTGDPRLDAYLAGMAEHFARQDQLPVPEWVEAPSRFLARAWFRAEHQGFWPMALAQSPVAFRRRRIFIDDTEFERV